MKARVLVAATVSIFVSAPATAAEIKVLAVGPLKEIFVDLVPQFEQKSGHTVATTWSGTADIKKRMAAGETYDVVIVSGPDIDALIKQGNMVAGSRLDLMKSGIGAGIRAGATKPDIHSSEALKQTMLTAKSIGYSTGPSGEHIASLFQRMGIADQVKSKVKQTPSGVRISTLIANGEVEIGFHQISELINEPGVDFIGPLPADAQKITVWSAGIHSHSGQPQAANALIEWLAAPTSASTTKKHGMEPR